MLAAKQTWDPSVQALLFFSRYVIKRLNSRLLLDDQSPATPFWRIKGSVDGPGCSACGSTGRSKPAKLKSTPQEKVVTTTESGQPAIEIQPADPDVIYVPD